MYFLRKIIFHFPSRKYMIFSRKLNEIFPDDTRKIIFQRNVFGKATLLEHLKKISYFHVLFWERSSFIFGLKNKIIFSGKRNLIFPGDARNIIFQFSFLERPSFQSTRKKKIWFFVQWQIKNGEKISILA